jgi:ATP/maltotriose-dependent transcriptional regulator MalT
LGELSRVHCAADRPDRALATAEAALEISQALCDRNLEANARTALGAALAATGRTDDSILQYTQAASASAVVGAPYFQAVATLSLARLAAVAGDITQATTLAERVLKHGRQVGHQGLEAQARTILALRSRVSQ